MTRQDGCMLFCPRCGKAAFADRKHARRARKRMAPTKGLRAYPCPFGLPWFHLGNVNPRVRKGQRTAREARAYTTISPSSS